MNPPDEVTAATRTAVEACPTMRRRVFAWMSPLGHLKALSATPPTLRGKRKDKTRPFQTSLPNECVVADGIVDWHDHTIVVVFPNRPHGL